MPSADRPLSAPVPDSALIGPAEPPHLHVMSWNIRRRLAVPFRPADGWRRRARRLSALLQYERPTILGTQEALPDQARFIGEALGPAYRFVGRGRQAEGRGEGCPLFYDSERLELTGWDQAALSDDPDRAGSTSWGNLVPRVVVSARFRDRSTGAHLLAFNTHFDPLSAASRLRSAQAIRLLVERSDVPAVVMGDLNDTPNSAALTALFAGEELIDSWAAAQIHETATWGTFSNYRAPRRGADRVDFIAVTPRIRALAAAINPRRYHGGWGSDHLPVQALISLPETAGQSG